METYRNKAAYRVYKHRRGEPEIDIRCSCNVLTSCLNSHRVKYKEPTKTKYAGKIIKGLEDQVEGLGPGSERSVAYGELDSREGGSNMG